ncbi:MAG: C40 family peptidase [Taibaiella sp.]|nr:C40 family peptidase [Taibaiella sp.]
MRSFTKGIALFCFAASTFFAGHSMAQQHAVPNATQHIKTESPHFINDISLGSNTNNIKMKVAENNTTKNKDEKTKQAEQPVLNIIQNKYAFLLGVLPQAITNFSLYNFIEDWYGVHYRLGGGDKSGIDCSAFVQRMYEQVFCTNMVRTAIEQFMSSDNIVKKTQTTEKLKEGDLVFFRIHSKRITHVGIYLMNNYFIHASSSNGVMISNLNDKYWHKYYAGAGQVNKG